LVCLGVLLWGLLCLGAKPLHPYRTEAEIDTVLALGPHAGDCEQCHTMHGKSEIVYPHALVGPDENTLCDGCHDTPWSGGSYAGATPYLGSSHGTGSGTIWPGPQPPPRTEAGAEGKCLNCHDPHGWPDASGLVPELLVAREENLCLTCHDGSPAATNIAAEQAKPYRHPMTSETGRHVGPAETDPARFAAFPQNNRHAECVDCHNPHVASSDAGEPPPAPALSRTNLGVGRVLAQNGAPGAPPAFTFAAGSDTLSAPVAEYQLCFKCHSSWTTQPTGQTDLAFELNPANPSFHPVEAAGRNATIASGAFEFGWSASSMTRCGDCHGSDFESAPRGPHGSAHPHILKRRYVASSQSRDMTSDELCFACHSHDVYANPIAPEGMLADSRFNRPGTTWGHAEHVGQSSVPCYACHVTHGSSTQKHLLVLGRSPGLVFYSETADGGTCQSTCHDARTYTSNYAR
jgi:predicted CXXCH cytochrome family protein